MPLGTSEPYPDSRTTAIPTVSVIIPTRDYAQYLPEAIATVQGQTLECWECIVVDDGSTDSTPELLAQLAAEDSRIRLRRQAASGVSVARNVGLAAARGVYVQFLDADDRLHPGKLATQIAALEARLDVGIVYGPTAYFSEAGGSALRQLNDPAASPAARLPESPDEALRLLLVHNRFGIEAPLVRRVVLEVVGPFNPGLARMEDWELWVRCAVAGIRFAYVPAPEPVAFVRVHAASASQREPDMLAAEIDVRERLDPLLLEHPAARRLNVMRLANRRMELAVLVALHGDVLVGLRTLLPLAIRSRRPRWILWALLLPLTSFDAGRRLLRRVRQRRHVRAEAE